MKESLYLRKKITELTERITFLKKKIVLLEDENLILRKKLSSERSFLQKIKDIFTGNIMFEVVMPWSKVKNKKLTEEQIHEEKIRKIG